MGSGMRICVMVTQIRMPDPNGIGAPQCYHLSMPRVPERPRLTTERKITAAPSDIQAIVRSDHSDPFAVLGPHRLAAGAHFAYRLEATDERGQVREFDDPYRFPSTLSDYDLHLLGEGTHYKAYEKLGANLRTLDGVAGAAFAVWAPNARRVSVVGDFNQWDGQIGRAHG